MSRRVLAGLLVLAGMVLMAGWFLTRSARRPELNGSLIQPPMPATRVDVTLMSTEGPVRLDEFRGRHTALFFGYTHCPDVCPMTLARMARAMEVLGPDAAERVRVVMITVDPERDTPERMARYARRFNPSFLGLSGERDAIDRVASAYGIFHAKAGSDGGPSGGYYVDHTASILVLDPKGRIRMMLGQDLTGEEIAADLAWLVG